jgi:hypothetical protein
MIQVRRPFAIGQSDRQVNHGVPEPHLRKIPKATCPTAAATSWASSGKFLYVPVEAANLTSPGRSLAVPLGPGETLPALPADGIRPEAKADEVPGALSVDREQLVGGQDPAHYAYVNTTVHRNLYRVSLP